jgi:hypothetical protein
MLGAVVLALALGACSSSSSGGGGGGTPFKQPAGTVAVNFTVDDTLNKTWKSEELQWKGSMVYDATTRIATGPDSSWSGPWAPLFDDGPWDQGGHEPLGAVANDHELGVTVFIKPPAASADNYEYGLIDAASGGWLWVGGNGTFSVPAGATQAITVAGMTFPIHGTIDFKLVLDKNNLASGFTIGSTTTVTVKGTASAWGEIAMHDDGTKGDDVANDGKFTYVLSQSIDPAKPPYPGLLKTGDKPEFVFVIGGVEYKTSSVCDTSGVTAETKPQGGAFTAQTIQIKSSPGNPSDGNTYITVP